jgi:NAD dependent epimerase/dehydratase family enzyme
VTNAEFTRTLARQLRRPAVLRAPAFALRLGLGEMANEVLLASARVFSSKLTNAGFCFKDEMVDTALAEALAAHCV